MQEQVTQRQSGRRKYTRIIAATVLTAAVIAALQVLPPGRDAFAGTPPVAEIGATPESFADLAARVSPAVVNIAASHTSQRASPTMRPPMTDRERFLKRFFPRFPILPLAPDGQRKGQAVGSGFLIDAAGVIVTNHHVIAGAGEITVTIHDGRKFQAQLVGADEKSDIAVLRIQLDEPLPYVLFGDSATTRVGDWVIAVGNPFGLGGTVTAGIVSARGRDIRSGPYDDFLQFDAPINQGNSGGPLFDRHGQVIGVNSAIFSPSGGNVGIGFAIPSDIVSSIVAELRDQGHVDRGWLGVHIQPLDAEIAEGLGRESTQGALVAHVVPDSPADQAGVRTGDIIIDFAGQPLENVRDLPRLVADTDAGAATPMTIWRDGRANILTVVVDQQPVEPTAVEQRAARQVPAEAQLGLALAELDDRHRRELGLAETVNGVLVANVRPGGSAARRGVRPGDVIVMVGQQHVTEPGQVAELVSQAADRDREAVVLLIHRRGQDRFLAIPFGNA